MDSIKKSMIVFLAMLFTISFVSATQEQVNIQINEYVDQSVTVNPLKYIGTSYGSWADNTENQSFYDLKGNINISNSNPNGKTISDIYVSFDYTTNITLPVFTSGRVGTFISNDTSSNTIVIHIPELNAGEYSYWSYSINGSNIRPPLNFTTSFSDTKILSGDNISLTDNIENVFDNAVYQTNTCIYGINITQNLVPVNFSGTNYYFNYFNNSIAGADASNVSFTPDNQTLNWNTLNGACLNKGGGVDINYTIKTPLSVPTSQDYTMVNTTLKYNLNQTISQLRVVDITAISEAKLDFEKKIEGPADPILYGSNVTWNVTGYFNTDTNISYNLTGVTFWVSQRNVNGSYTDPNTVDNDTISNSSLKISSNPFVLVNSTTPWASGSWQFNYSDIPSPIVWMDANFTIQNDGTQLVDRSVSQNGNDIYIKELYLIVGYWLEINKNITAISNNSYHIRIDVRNKGNQVTPAGTVVTIYDFIPANYNLSSAFSFSDPAWYDTSATQNNVSGYYNGTLHQWAITPTNVLNVSFAEGPVKNINNSWSVDYNVTGMGDYELMDVFITGLDPQKVDGAGSSKAVVIEEVLDRISSTEGIFATVASVLLLLGLLL